jgi:hypothetical protein
MISGDGNDSSPRPKPKPRQRAKPYTLKKSLYLDDDDSETTQVNLQGHDLKMKTNRAPAAVKHIHDAAAKSRCRTRSTKPSKTVAAPNTDGDESQMEPKVEIKSSGSQIKVKHKTDAKNSSKRPRGVDDADEHEQNLEGSATTRKRAKTIASPISDDETLVEPAQSKAGSPKVPKGKPPEMYDCLDAVHLSEQTNMASVLAVQKVPLERSKGISLH